MEGTTVRESGSQHNGTVRIVTRDDS